MEGIKHLIQCHCILPQYRNRKDPLFHKFIVFSIIEDDDSVRHKFVSCNNCGVVHKIVEIGKSEVVIGKEDIGSAITIEDIKLSMPKNISEVLKAYNCSLPTWEEALFLIENDRWGSEIVLTIDAVDNGNLTQGKILKLVSPPATIKIESFLRENTLSS